MMSRPSDPDDPWADLYRDLEVDAKKNDTIEQNEAELPESDAVDLDNTDELSEEVEESDDLADAELDAESGDDATPDESEPKKRRRRRRRRKKKSGATQSLAENEESTPELEPELNSDTEETILPNEADSFDDEIPASDSTRELISSWNVPSWQEIVASLYRPDRG